MREIQFYTGVDKIDRLAAIADVLGLSLAALLTEDEGMAAIMAQLAQRPDLVGEVAFFLKSLEQEMPASDERTLPDPASPTW